MKFLYDTDYFPPAPSVDIRLGIPDESFTIGPLSAFVDTGADATLVPLQYIRPLRIQIDNRKYLRSQWGERRIVDTYLLDIGINDIRLPLIEIVTAEWSEEVILGQNVLNKLRLILDGPKQVMEVLA